MNEDYVQCCHFGNSVMIHEDEQNREIQSVGITLYTLSICMVSTHSCNYFHRN